MTDHNRLIRDAARRHLAPLGVQQKGRSRTWIDDRGWWLISIEFQPSAWSRGTYLNVGASWLWYFKDFLSFDLGYRVENFQELTGPGASEACDRVASRAAEEVQALRRRICDIEAVAREMRVGPEEQLWPSYHAAVAHALIGDVDEARRRFERLAFPDTVPEFEWVTELRRRSALLLPFVGNHAAFAQEIKSIINQTRRALKLPEWSGEFSARKDV